MPNQEFVSPKIGAFMRLTRILAEQRMHVRRAVAEKDGTGVGPWLVFKDGVIVEGGTLSDLMAKHVPA